MSLHVLMLLVALSLAAAAAAQLPGLELPQGVGVNTALPRALPEAKAESPLGCITSMPPEAPGDRDERHKQIGRRRSGPVVIVHRGASAFAPENTLEAYAAAMDYGADGCEIDIRRTTDGVLFMFHDDGLDRMTDALGPASDHAYSELLTLPFRSEFHARPETRIPTLAAILEVARQRAMLLHLDVKEPGLEEGIAALLDAADMWDHVVEINVWNAAALRENPKYHPLAYKASGLGEGRADMDPEKVRDALAGPGNMIMVDDPRVAARELKRKPLRVPLPDTLRAPLPPNRAVAAASQGDLDSLSPTAYLQAVAERLDRQSLDDLGEVLAAELPERTDLGGDAARQQQRACRILERAWAAQRIAQLGDTSARAAEFLEHLVAHRSLHRNYAYQGLDGAMAVRALGMLAATDSAPFLLHTFLAVDSELEKMVAPPASYPYAWADYRLKREIICALGELRCEPAAAFLREYVAMDEATAGKSAPPLFEDATRALLRQGIASEELAGLLRSPNPAVRGTALLSCLDDGVEGRADLLGEILPWTRELPRAGQ
ncbi:MAG: glycerophosphodiester phosphodiesterase family protein [Armatimonadetes bacterium]|nr:glycerophosphodiester phosphodiesterase family protein [Armatimonadota bacterium]